MIKIKNNEKINDVVLFLKYVGISIFAQFKKIINAFNYPVAWIVSITLIFIINQLVGWVKNAPNTWVNNILLITLLFAIVWYDYISDSWKEYMRSLNKRVCFRNYISWFWCGFKNIFISFKRPKPWVLSLTIGYIVQEVLYQVGIYPWFVNIRFWFFLILLFSFFWLRYEVGEHRYYFRQKLKERAKEEFEKEWKKQTRVIDGENEGL